jgi:phospholipid/cholesterol/gamma-HCH transport system ATP-binding protein
MSGLVAMKNIRLKGYSQTASFTISAGVSAVMITSGQEANDQVVRLLLGLERQTFGEVDVCGIAVQCATEREIYQLRERVGVVYPDGGLIANLRAFENLVLPLEFRGALSSDATNSRGIAVLQRLGFDGEVHAPVATLSRYQKRLLGLGRAMLCDPDVLLVCGLLSDLSTDERENLVTNMTEFHHEKPGRITLYITADPEAAHGFGSEQIIQLRGE